MSSGGYHIYFCNNFLFCKKRSDNSHWQAIKYHGIQYGANTVGSTSDLLTPVRCSQSRLIPSPSTSRSRGEGQHMGRGGVTYLDDVKNKEKTAHISQTDATIKSGHTINGLLGLLFMFITLPIGYTLSVLTLKVPQLIGPIIIIIINFFGQTTRNSNDTAMHGFLNHCAVQLQQLEKQALQWYLQEELGTKTILMQDSPTCVLDGWRQFFTCLIVYSIVELVGELDLHCYWPGYRICLCSTVQHCCLALFGNTLRCWLEYKLSGSKTNKSPSSSISTLRAHFSLLLLSDLCNWLPYNAITHCFYLYLCY